MKKRLIILSLLWGSIAISTLQADQTSYCDREEIARQINAAKKGDPNAKKLYRDHCNISASNDDRCEIKWVSDGFDRYQENVCAKATLKE